jgi:hypothetical protein
VVERVVVVWMDASAEAASPSASDARSGMIFFIFYLT